MLYVPVKRLRRDARISAFVDYTILENPPVVNNRLPSFLMPDEEYRLAVYRNPFGTIKYPPDLLIAMGTALLV
jgi:hypothetical protein